MRNNVVNYMESGFVVVPDLFEMGLLEQIFNEIKRIFFPQMNYTERLALGINGFSEALINLRLRDEAFFLGAAASCNFLPKLISLSVEPKVISIINSIGVDPLFYGKPMIRFDHPGLSKSANYWRLPAHQDFTTMQGSLNGVVFWLPLVSLSDSMGKLQCIPGSHKRLLPCKDVDGYKFAVKSELSDLQFVELDIPLGGGVFFSNLLIHRSGVNSCNDIRLTVNFRYNDLNDQNWVRRSYHNPFRYIGVEDFRIQDFT